MTVMDGQKDDNGKDRWELVPWSALRQIVAAITYGARKYSADNWKRVEPARYRAALMRHVSASFSGERVDAESGLPHLAHAGACLLFILWHEAEGEENGR